MCVKLSLDQGEAGGSNPADLRVLSEYQNIKNSSIEKIQLRHMQKSNWFYDMFPLQSMKVNHSERPSAVVKHVFSVLLMHSSEGISTFQPCVLSEM